jgi:Zn finger protein HypA/HybF involved in hydrogenase expression
VSNSAAKKARRRSNIFENDVDDLLYCSEAIKLKNLEVEKIKPAKTKPTALSTAPEAISSVPVKCKCNKCSNSILGVLTGVLYSPLSGLNTPLITYSCSTCGHKGRRSVLTQGLPTAEFERLYF